MRERRIRSQIYLPVVRLGVNDCDWKFVVVIALLAYSIPFALDLTVKRIPLAIPGGVVGLVGAIAFFNFIRRGRRAHWLQHTIAGLLTPKRLRRRIPADSGRTQSRPWILDLDGILQDGGTDADD